MKWTKPVNRIGKEKNIKASRDDLLSGTKQPPPRTLRARISEAGLSEAWKPLISIQVCKFQSYTAGITGLVRNGFTISIYYQNICIRWQIWKDEMQSYRDTVLPFYYRHLRDRFNFENPACKPQVLCIFRQLSDGNF